MSNEKEPADYRKWELCGHDILLRDCAECMRKRIPVLQAEVDALKAQVARLSAPVTDAECAFYAHYMNEDGGPCLAIRLNAVNTLILARATPPQDVEKGGKE